MSRTRVLTGLLIILIGGTVLRTLWLTADPPTRSVGVVWHDEGAWVHNARNMALWGVWQTDNWNPVFIAPVFTAFEYGAFRTFGVGTWQARTVPVVSGLIALIAIMLGLRALAARNREQTFLVGGLLLGANFTWVMWNRAALMESTMTMFIVVAWAAYAVAGKRPAFGLLAGSAATLAYFTKASAAFFVAAIVLDALWTLIRARLARPSRRAADNPPLDVDVRAAWLTLLGVTLSAAVITAAFVLPHWQEYRFYNWEMSVERKPSYDLGSLVMKASWIPVVQDIFMRMWLVLAAAGVAMLGIVARWGNARPAERLLVLWVVLGLAELIVHDSGNERRYVMFIPALVALAALVMGRAVAVLPEVMSQAGRAMRWLLAPLALALGYVVFGSLVRWIFISQIEAPVDRVFSGAVRTGAALAVLATVVLIAFWSRLSRQTGAVYLPPMLASVLVSVSLGYEFFQYSQWGRHRTDLNYQASVALGEFLAPGTLVHGKLANGLDLENQIKPIFVGRGFGNYDDRFSRDDARYILTISLPAEGRESQPGLMKEIIDHYPNRRIIATFEIDDTPQPDQAVLIDKNPAAAPAVSGSNRAPD